jgi:hypothetical protein
MCVLNCDISSVRILQQICNSCNRAATAATIYLASAYCYICVLILLFLNTCPHAALHVSSYGYICVLRHLHVLHIRQHTSAYVSIRQLIIRLHM